MKLNIFGKNEKKSKKVAPPADVAVSDTVKEVSVALPASVSGKSVLNSIYTSEKSTGLISLNQYVFKVDLGATKNEIKKEVAARYNVKVKDVKVINRPGKKKRVGRYEGMRPGYRKAIVVLYPGNVIQQAKP